MQRTNKTSNDKVLKRFSPISGANLAVNIAFSYFIIRSVVLPTKFEYCLGAQMDFPDFSTAHFDTDGEMKLENGYDLKCSLRQLTIF